MLAPTKTLTLEPSGQSNSKCHVHATTPKAMPGGEPADMTLNTLRVVPAKQLWMRQFMVRIEAETVFGVWGGRGIGSHYA